MSWVKDILIRFRGDSGNLTSETKKAGAVLDNFTKQVKGMAAGLAAAFSVNAIWNFGKESVQAFDESAKAAAKLLAVTKGNVAEQQRLLDNAALLQSKTLFDDETIVNAQIFLRSLNLTTDQIIRITPLIADFATKMGTDMASAANLVAKTIGSDVNALARYGIQVEGAAGSTERFEMAMAGLTKQVGGLSTAAAEAGTGSFVQFKNALNDIQEVIGAKLSPYLTKLAGHMKAVAELKSGIAEKNFATQYIEEARAAMQSAKSTEEANKALANQKKRLEELKPVIEEQSDAAKLTFWQKFDSKKFHGSNRIMSESEAQIRGIGIAITTLDEQIASGKALEWLAAKPEVIIDPDKAKAEAEALQKEADAMAKAAREAAVLQNAMTALVEAGNKLDVNQWLKQSQITGNKPGETGWTESLRTGAAAMKQIAPMPLPPMGERQLMPSVYTQKDLDVLRAAADLFEQQYTEMVKVDNMTAMLADSFQQLGDSLAAGAESWDEFGKKAVNALRQVVAGLIAKGIASTVEKSLSELPPIVGLAVGAVSGGLAAGLFNTLVPSFASGGYVSSPTIARIGDAKDGKGEWVLNSTQMAALGGGGGGRLSVDVTGRALRFVLDNEDLTQKRLGK